MGYVSHVSEFTKIKIKIMIRHNKLSQNYHNSWSVNISYVKIKLKKNQARLDTTKNEECCVNVVKFIVFIYFLN